MTKPEALYKFFSGFGLVAYPDTSVPADAEFPYLTYSASFDSFGNQVIIQANLYYLTESELIPTLKSEEISKVVNGGVYIPCDGGAILVTKGSPFCQSMADVSNPLIKRRYINLVAEYLTLY